MKKIILFLIMSISIPLQLVPSDKGSWIGFAMFSGICVMHTCLMSDHQEHRKQILPQPKSDSEIEAGLKAIRFKREIVTESDCTCDEIDTCDNQDTSDHEINVYTNHVPFSNIHTPLIPKSAASPTRPLLPLTVINPKSMENSQRQHARMLDSSFVFVEYKK